MKVTLFLDKSQGDTLEVKDKILSVIKPEHMIFDHWDGDELKTKFTICNNTGETSVVKARNKEAAVVEYITKCNGYADGQLFKNYAQVLTYDKLVSVFNDKYALCNEDKIVRIN